MSRRWMASAAVCRDTAGGDGFRRCRHQGAAGALVAAVGPSAAGAQVAQLLWGFVEQDIGIFGHGMFSAPHSLLRWRGQRKLKVGIQRRLEALLPGVPPVETTARAMAVLGYAVRLVAQCREAIRLAPIQAAQHGPPLVWRSRQVP